MEAPIETYSFIAPCNTAMNDGAISHTELRFWKTRTESSSNFSCKMLLLLSSRELLRTYIDAEDALMIVWQISKASIALQLGNDDGCGDDLVTDARGELRVAQLAVGK
jgi:hypothetical protein